MESQFTRAQRTNAQIMIHLSKHTSAMKKASKEREAIWSLACDVAMEASKAMMDAVKKAEEAQAIADKACQEAADIAKGIYELAERLES